MNLIDKINKKQIRKDIPEFRAGDNVTVNVWITEGKKRRIQAFSGLVVSKKGGSVNESFTVRKQTKGYAVKRVFPLHSPVIDSITVDKKGVVRRAKLNYVDKMAKEFKTKERN